MSAGAWRIPILIVQDHKENRRKCSLTPIEGAAGVDFVRLPPRSPQEVLLPPGILLAVGAPPLEAGDRVHLEGGRLILVDATWARLPSVMRRLQPAPGARIERRSLPPGARTAYPRISKVHHDPPAGLASIEALYLATAILGEPRPELLAGYRWREEFLELNGKMRS